VIPFYLALGHGIVMAAPDMFDPGIGQIFLQISGDVVKTRYDLIYITIVLDNACISCRRSYGAHQVLTIHGPPDLQIFPPNG
jgi:hypothetical protein